MPISSRKIVPPIGELELALLVGGRTSKCPATMTEELRLEQCIGNGRAVHFDQRHVTLCAAVVNRTRHHLFTRPGLTRNKHRALRFRNQFRSVNHLLHLTAPSDNAVLVELFAALVEQVSVLCAQALMLDRATDDDQ